MSDSLVGVVRFGGKGEVAPLGSKEVLGGKGANLVEMASLKVPVPPGFVIPCACSVKYKSLTGESHKEFMSQLFDEIDGGLQHLFNYFGEVPLVSVRSGARVSMPGMMDTILNVGITDDTLPTWIAKLGDRAALDSYRRLLQMYGSVVFEIPMEKFEHALEKVKDSADVKEDSELSPSYLADLVVIFKNIIKNEGHMMPTTPRDQVRGAVLAVFRSWDNPRAKEYRKIHSIPEDWGTGVTVQSMVFGNLNDASATGVVFTRCPSTGLDEFVGEFLVNAQGEDVVAGIRTPEPIAEMVEWAPGVFTKLADTLLFIEKHYKDMHDVEFTVQDGELFILQTRSGKRSARSAVTIAVGMATEGVITKKEAVSRVSQKHLAALMQRTLDPKFKTPPHLVGIAGGGGLVSGVAVFTAEDAVNCKEPCILVRKETDPDDIAGMNAAVGILTATGGLTSHAAVVARGMNKSCVVGTTDMVVNESASVCSTKAGKELIFNGTKVTLDGATGNVWVGIDVPVVEGGKSEDLLQLLRMAVDVGGFGERVQFSGNWETVEKDVLACIASSLHIDTSVLEGPNRTSTKGLMMAMNALGMALRKSKAEEFMVDLASMSSVWGLNDLAFECMLSETGNEEEILQVKVSSIEIWPNDVLSKCFISLPPHAGAATKSKLAGLGVRLSIPIATVADLLASSGPIRVEPYIIQSVFGTKEAFDTLCDMVSSSKESKIYKAPVPTYWFDMLNGD